MRIFLMPWGGKFKNEQIYYWDFRGQGADVSV